MANQSVSRPPARPATTDYDRPWRGVAFMGVAVALGAALAFRLHHLQIAQGGRFLKQAEGNRLRIIPHLAPRGIIRDRHGRLLASNRLSYSLVLYTIKMPRKKVEEVLERLEKVLTFDVAEVREKVARLGFSSPHPIKLVGDIDQTTIARVAEHQAELPGVAIEPDNIRYYPYGSIAAHVLGYTGEVAEWELAQEEKDGPKQGDIVGKAGIERSNDKTLRGENGSQQVEVDARGRPVQVLRMVPAVAGKDLKLFLDLDLQRIAEDELSKQKLTGAVVAMNPTTGEVLALASRPTFDPNLFSRKVKAEDWKRLQKANFPFVNRATSAYPPGSIYKVPMALAALESGKATAGRTFYSSGSLLVGNRVFHDWNARGFGNVTIVQSLQWSIDTVYYQLGVEMGGKTMARYAHENGLGELTGIALPGESKGLIPDPIWKRQVMHDKWWPGDSANVAIGQGAVNVTPLQAAVMISTIANGGKVLVPRLVDDGKGPIIRRESHWKPQNLAIVHKGLRMVVDSGTGTVADVPGQKVSGKTGSAESGKRKTHAWFICFAPAVKPTIAICTFAEAAGHGGEIAGPIARKLLDQYFGNKDGTIRRSAVLD